MTKQAIVYTRFSPRPNARECDSCEKQEERCLAYCRRQQYNVRGTYEDKNVSGGSLNRPALLEILEYIKPGDILVVDSSDRLARDLGVGLAIEEQVEQASATIEFADGTPCDNTPEGKLQRRILACFNAFERDRIRFRTKRGLDRKRKNGERTTGKIPIGWKLDPEDPKRLVRHETERQAILHACKLRALEDMSSSEIAYRLDRDFPPCRGKPWSARTVRKIIKREAYWADPIDGDMKLEPTHP